MFNFFIDRPVFSTVISLIITLAGLVAAVGLPIAQSLVNRQGGLIGFTSEPGNTVFTVWLPIRNDI